VKQGCFENIGRIRAATRSEYSFILIARDLNSNRSIDARFNSYRLFMVAQTQKRSMPSLADPINDGFWRYSIVRT